MVIYIITSVSLLLCTIHILRETKTKNLERTASKTTPSPTTRCTVEERDLCFVCFRGEHLEGEERLWHNWETSKAFTCQVCAQRDATLVCAECPDKGPESRGGKRGKRPGRGAPGTTPSSSADVGGGSGGVVLCDNCWERTHAHEDVRHHTRFTVDQWAARARGGGTPVEEGGGSLTLLQAKEAGGGGVVAQNEVMAIVEPTGWGDTSGGGGDHHGDGGDAAAYEYDYDYSGGAEQYDHEPY